MRRSLRVANTSTTSADDSADNTEIRSAVYVVVISKDMAPWMRSGPPVLSPFCTVGPFLTYDDAEAFAARYPASKDQRCRVIEVLGVDAVQCPSCEFFWSPRKDGPDCPVCREEQESSPSWVPSVVHDEGTDTR
jgi:hypothetical protein